MENIREINVQLLTFWFSCKLKKIYLECRSVEHLICNDKIVVENGTRVKLVYSIEDIQKTQEQFLSKITKNFPRLTAEINLDTVKSVKSDGFTYNAYQTTNITCLE